MVRTVFLLFIAFLFACNVPNQRQRNAQLAESVFKQGSLEMQEGSKTLFSDSLAREIHYRLALDLMNKAIELDSTKEEYSAYHADLYDGLGIYDSALLWALKGRPLQVVPIDSFNYSRNSWKIAMWYFRMGDTTNGKISAMQSLKIDPSWRVAMAEKLFDLSNDIYERPFRGMHAIESSCLVSLNILEFSFALTASNRGVKTEKYKNAIKDRIFNCGQGRLATVPSK